MRELLDTFNGWIARATFQIGDIGPMQSRALCELRLGKSHSAPAPFNCPAQTCLETFDSFLLFNAWQLRPLHQLLRLLRREVSESCV